MTLITAEDLYGKPCARFTQGDVDQLYLPEAIRIKIPQKRALPGKEVERLNPNRMGDGAIEFHTQGINQYTETWEVETIPLPMNDAKVLFLQLRELRKKPFEWLNRPADALLKYYFISSNEISKRSEGVYRGYSFTVENWKNPPQSSL